MGCYERTLALLLEKYAGALPTWMAPVQVKFLPIGDDQIPYCDEIERKLAAFGVRCEIDKRNETIGYKLRNAQLEKVPFMVVVGAKEVEGGTVSVRSRREGEKGAMSVADFLSLILDEIAQKRR
jgi:threonyl-tRNA synthetase